MGLNKASRAYPGRSTVPETIGDSPLTDFMYIGTFMVPDIIKMYMIIIRIVETVKFRSLNTFS